MSKKSKQRPAEDLDPLAGMLSGLWAALAAGNVLQAEIETARCCSIFHQLGIDQDKSDSIFIGMAKQGGKPEDAALLRLIMLLGSPAVKGQARAALGELTAKGVYPASWVTEAGKAEPVRASRVYDLFGDREDVRVTFRYENGEHTLTAEIDLTDLPLVRRITLIDGEPSPGQDGPFEMTEQISLASARQRLEPALIATGLTAFPEARTTAALLPIAKSRLRRLPADGAEAGPVYTSEQRSALVREFLASPHAAEPVAEDEDSTRFWAQILTAWSSRVPSHPPLQAGPRTLWHILAVHVPYTYPVTPRQLNHIAPAVTAWARWSAAQRGLDEEHMISELPAALTDFPVRYDDEFAAEHRAYLADIVTSDADIVSLTDAWKTRAIAIPPSELRDESGEGLRALDGADPADRATFLAADFATCEPPAGLSRADFLGVLGQVAGELWDPAPSSTRDQARTLLAEGNLGSHEVMHALVRRALSHRN